jgi:hypothetical protein
MDEMSLAGLTKFGTVDQLFKCATGKHEHPLGGIHFILSFDFYQLPPVMDKPLYYHSKAGLNAVETSGWEAYRSCTTFSELTQQMRQKGSTTDDDRFRASLHRNRVGTCSEVDTCLNAERTFSTSDDPVIQSLPPTTLYVSARKDSCGEINHLKHTALVNNGGSAIHIWAKFSSPVHHSRSVRKHPQLQAEFNDDATESIRVLDDSEQITAVTDVAIRKELLSAPPKALKMGTHLTFCVGDRVVLQMNTGTIVGLVNGSLGTVKGFIYDANDDPRMPGCDSVEDAAYNLPALPIVLVQFDPCSNGTYPFASFLPDMPGIIPVAPEKI